MFLLKHFDMSSVAKALVTWKFNELENISKKDMSLKKQNKKIQINGTYILWMLSRIKMKPSFQEISNRDSCCDNMWIFVNVEEDMLIHDVTK